MPEKNDILTIKIDSYEYDGRVEDIETVNTTLIYKVWIFAFARYFMITKEQIVSNSPKNYN